MSISRNHKNRLVPHLIIMMFITLITACVDSDDETDPGDSNNQPTVTLNRTLTGTAATGAAVEGTVTILDADGNSLTTQSDASGAYSVNLEGRSGPYLIRFVPNDSALPVMYSHASNSGVANITQFTSLALVLAYQNLDAAFANWVTILADWKRVDLEQALARINANFSDDLLNAAVEPTLYDLFTAPFDADQTGIDAFLDNYTVTFDYSNSTYVITDNSSGQVRTFDLNIPTDGYYIGAWFIPEGTAIWELTLTITINGAPQVTGPFTIATDTVPWSRERYDDLFWDALPETSTQTISCENDLLTHCDITVQTSQLDNNYNIIGNGEIGTQIDASFAFSWNATGTMQGISPTGIPFSEDINESYSWSYAWRWQRVN